jgi:hypothetical protein
MAAVTGLPDDASRLNTAVTERERLASVAARGFARNADSEFVAVMRTLRLLHVQIAWFCVA